jgi:hypothetical protein
MIPNYHQIDSGFSACMSRGMKLCSANPSWALVAVGVGTAVSAAGTAYASNQKSKATGKLAQSLSKTKEFEPQLLGDPKQINTSDVTLRTVDNAYDRLGYIRRFVDQLNAIDYSTAMRYYRKIQPSFDQLQSQIGKNALSYSRGELPQDVSAEIGRKAAERGIQAGYGFGTQGGKTGALAALNLRNLGLTSLDLSRFGTQLGMQVNQSAKSLLPAFRSPADFMLTPGQQLGAEQYNVGVTNDFAVRNNALLNQAGMQNTSLANAVNQQQAQLAYSGQVGDAQMWAQLAQSLGGAISGMGGGGGVFGGQQQPVGAGQSINSMPVETWRQNAAGVTSLA